MPEEYGGPFLQIAAICEKVLQEKDGVLSLIRVVDRFFLSGPEKEMPQIPFQFLAVITFKAGIARGKFTVKLRVHTPSGNILPEQEFPVLFEGEDRGVNVLAQVGFLMSEEGLYWVDVILEDAIMTRMPLRVVYQKAGPPVPPK